MELMKAGYPPIDIKFADQISYYNASDEYHVFVESQDVVHQLKHEIRVTDKER